MSRRPSRSPATLPGYRKGEKPANAGMVFPPHPMTDDDVVTLIVGCSRTSNVGLRDRALLALLYRSGLRIAEALNLQVTDLRPDEHSMVVRRGKGGKTRIAWMDDFGWEHVQLWLERRGTLTAPGAGWLFCTISRPGAGGRLGSPQVRTMMKRKARQAGMTRRVNPHAMRHGYAVGLIREGATLPEVSRALGHSSVATTNTYVNHVDPAAMVALARSRPRPGGPVETDAEAWRQQADAAGPQTLSPAMRALLALEEDR